ncbi:MULTISPECIES: Cof-type HAD-IIB family hydrolase [Bacillus]|uniref:Cof-type HAD-IIB family hydrolase n=2 Tax=Bacillaceae TaxID=186817 RepID=UPI000BFA5B65|nr:MULTISPECIES: Cof-type HAD-IIB family hydrolase [Bacillus]AYF06726.1 HAD family phosphatase [Bacillus mobilis]PEU78715.1 HAD family hydrolase [Bacillus cereus]PGT76603.1 HAD family hydrolase [Bacillus cereus]PGV88184.1 HAD family hydrolase [Bacillus cereus]BCD29621.1 HAD superfamily hydrolase [Bacillus cereus]
MKLIAIDLDGTLLSGNKMISKENADAIRKCQEAGHVVTICTGRSIVDIERLLLEVNLECPIIAENGALIYKDKKMMKRYPIENMQALEIVDYLEENGLYYQLYTNKGVYVPDYGVESVRNEIEYVKNSKENFDLKELETIAALYLEHTAFHGAESCKPIVETDIHVHKLLPFSYDIEKLKKLKAAFLHNTDLAITSSYWHNLEINHRDAQKGNGLYTLAEHLNIPVENTVAIGDGLNDVSMMEKANISIAMGNAVEEIKAMCQYETLSNEEHGVAHALYKYVM